MEGEVTDGEKYDLQLHSLLADPEFEHFCVCLESFLIGIIPHYSEFNFVSTHPDCFTIISRGDNLTG
jgi:hypothetical protein